MRVGDGWEWLFLLSAFGLVEGQEQIHRNSLSTFGPGTGLKNRHPQIREVLVGWPQAGKNKKMGGRRPGKSPGGTGRYGFGTGRYASGLARPSNFFWGGARALWNKNKNKSIKNDNSCPLGLEAIRPLTHTNMTLLHLVFHSSADL